LTFLVGFISHSINLINEDDKLASKLKTILQNIQDSIEKKDKLFKDKEDSTSKHENILKSLANLEAVLNEYSAKYQKTIEEKDTLLGELKDKLESILLIINNSNDGINYQIQNNQLYDQKVN
jgi:predicted nuclease with TOPRIM domain